jgi:hypothetical protein
MLTAKSCGVWKYGSDRGGDAKWTQKLIDVYNLTISK